MAAELVAIPLVYQIPYHSTIALLAESSTNINYEVNFDLLILILHLLRRIVIIIIPSTEKYES
jgi:hypothetical protein